MGDGAWRGGKCGCVESREFVRAQAARLERVIRDTDFVKRESGRVMSLSQLWASELCPLTAQAVLFTCSFRRQTSCFGRQEARFGVVLSADTSTIPTSLLESHTAAISPTRRHSLSPIYKRARLSRSAIEACCSPCLVTRSPDPHGTVCLATNTSTVNSAQTRGNRCKGAGHWANRSLCGVVPDPSATGAPHPYFAESRSGLPVMYPMPAWPLLCGGMIPGLPPLSYGLLPRSSGQRDRRRQKLKGQMRE